MIFAEKACKKFIMKNKYSNMEHIIMTNPPKKDDCKEVIRLYNQCYKENSVKPKSCDKIKKLLSKLAEMNCTW